MHRSLSVSEVFNNSAHVVAATILKQPSVQAPNRWKRLQTFTDKKENKSRMSQLEKDKNTILCALKKKMMFAQKRRIPISCVE